MKRGEEKKKRLKLIIINLTFCLETKEYYFSEISEVGFARTYLLHVSILIINNFYFRLLLINLSIIITDDLSSSW